MEDKLFFEELNNRLKDGTDLSSKLRKAWSAHNNPYPRNQALLDLWRAMFPGHTILSPKVHTLDFLELSDKLSSHTYYRFPNTKLVIGRSIGLRYSTQVNARYMDNHDDIMGLFRILHSYGDTVLNYVSRTHKASLSDLITVIKESSNFKRYIYANDLKFSVTSTHPYKFYTSGDYSKYYSEHNLHNILNFKGTKDGHTCKCDCGRTIISDDGKEDYLAIGSAKQGVTNIIEHLIKLTEEINSGDNIKEIRNKLSRHILLNTI